MRDIVEGMYYCKKLQEAGCSLVLVKDAFLRQVDTSTPMGEFMLVVIFAVGQLERKLILERTKEGIEKYKKIWKVGGEKEEGRHQCRARCGTLKSKNAYGGFEDSRDPAIYAARALAAR